MKILVVSDLHLEFGDPYTVPAGLDFDAVVLAGDISSPGTDAIHWAQRESTFGGRPVIFVAGNHEFYNRVMRVELEKMKAAAADSNVHILNRSGVVIDGVRFLGCVLWTDFQLPLRMPGGELKSSIKRALRAAGDQLNDFRLIEVDAEATANTNGAAGCRPFQRVLRPADTMAMHWIDRDWLRCELTQPFQGSTVVVTHHAPAIASVAARYAADWLTPAFVSQLPSTIFKVPCLWTHGHTHTSFDYMEGTCRVVSNPRGYRVRDGRFENQHFDRGFVVEVAS